MDPSEPDSGHHGVLHSGNRRAAVRDGVPVPVPAIARGLFRTVGGGVGAAACWRRSSAIELLRTAQSGLAGALCHLRIRLRHRTDRGGARRIRVGREGLAHGAAADRDSADFRGAGLGDRAVWPGWRPITPRTRSCWGSSTSTTSTRCAGTRGWAAASSASRCWCWRRPSSSTPIILLYLYNRGGAPIWAGYLHHETYYDFVLHCVLAFAAMAMWSESQIDRMRDLGGEAGPPAPRARTHVWIWTA